MVDSRPATAPKRPGPAFQAARDPESRGTQLRIILGLIVTLILVLASLALLNSFFLEPRPGNGPENPAPGPTQTAGSAGGGGGGGGFTCKDLVKILNYTFIVVLLATVVLFAVAILRREHHQGRIASSVWGILATLGFFFSLLVFGAWRLANTLCNETLTCAKTQNGAYTAFMFLLALTLLSIGLGIAFAARDGRNFFLTGWGLIAILLYLPTILTGFAWYVVRLVCTPKLSCATRTHFLSDLATIFWFGLILGLVAVGIGVWVQRRWKRNMFESGWAVLAFLLLFLAILAGAGWKTVHGIYIPFCDGPPKEQNQTEPTCQQLKHDVQSRISTTGWILFAIAVTSLGIGIYLNRTNWRRAFKSWWGIIFYLALALALLMVLLHVLSDSLCGGQNNNDQGQGPGGTGGPAGSGQPGGGNQGGTGPGGGGGGNGGGGGGGGLGSAAAPPPIQLGAIPIVWVLIIVGAVVGAALLYVLLQQRKVSLKRAGPPAVPTTEVQATERAGLLKIIDGGRLTSAEAVIAAYRSFLAWSLGHGLDKYANETPHEHAERVREHYPVPASTMDAFVHAYEVARLSHREPTPEERRLAVRFSHDIDTAGWSRESDKGAP